MRAKKSLGQNFLKNKRIITKMLAVTDLQKDDVILEIGPGKGFLTSEILKTKNKIILLEKDKDLIKILSNEY